MDEKKRMMKQIKNVFVHLNRKYHENNFIFKNNKLIN